MNNAKTKSDTDGEQYLKDSFQREQELLESKLLFANQNITHNGERGEVNEKHFIEYLRSHLPKRYSVDSAIVVDSNGKTSNQIDIVVYDNQYTPTLFAQQDFCYVPAEAVYAVIEVKPEVNRDYIEYAQKQAYSVEALERTSIEITHAGGVYKPKPLFKIITGLIALKTGWQEGLASNSFKDAIQMPYTNQTRLDFVTSLQGGHFDCFEKGNEHYSQQNHLTFFLFRLLSQLQSLGTVPAVDWNKYANVLTEQSKPD
ncbi:DUF6602 domain-containing protein [Marinomonas mediterranea]|jgi:hypothetical protein|uniref:DUF6602 domain-containing protein n=1 Tax=Marinomonas mediterranea (strain ATCC 700492 / JCM 21426 / NBRC 103028 / MMB-1) TaxID=717774 RepID=F2K1W0_MARM1|nr:DUF6602 domain-containing protein [Marinomonas mediterranea]ADZ89954.1 hypothetical protein Marme_0670 [Marinomonas mediterranea MMB-1]WCN16164.1 hypothetical protein GV053_03355 [Marinomonas mediterranea MMB-1]